MPYSIVFPFDGAPSKTPPGKNGDICSADGKVVFSRIDAGVDMYRDKDSHLYAAADGTIVIHIDSGNGSGGFGIYPVLMLDHPIVLDNNVGTATGIYYGHTKGLLKPGETKHYKANEQIGTVTAPSGGNAASVHDGWLEIGFWNPANGGPIGKPTSQEASTAAGTEMFKALFGSQSAPNMFGQTAVQGAASAGGDGKGSSGGDSSGSGSGSGSSDTAAEQAAIDASLAYASKTQDAIPDPRDNRPFSPWFLGQVMGPYGDGIPQGVLPASGQGGFRWYENLPNLPQGTQMPTVRLVRGGLTEIPPREGGRLSVFFMMNPESISSSISLDPSQATPDSLTGANQQAQVLTTSQSITFTLWFNRMYEVWYGDMPGPSDEGVRWDIRALERLVGLVDANAAQSATSFGLSKNMSATGAAGSYPVQVVFGGANSIQFQGRIQSLQYTYTRFDANMIPVEASVDVGVMRVYNPPTGADLVAPFLYVPEMIYNNSSVNVYSNTAPTGGIINPVTGLP